MNDDLANDLRAVVRMLEATEPGGPAVSKPSGFRDAIACLNGWAYRVSPTPTAPTDDDRRSDLGVLGASTEKEET